MSRMILAAGITMATLLVAATFIGQPAEDLSQSAERGSPIESPLALSLQDPAAPQDESAAELPTEIASILEARRHLGPVVEGTILDQQDDSRDFAESLERLLVR